jgi:HAMP domain-containing protein
MFTMLGLVRATAVRVAGGDTPAPALQALARASDFTFLIYTGLGIALTLLLARTLTRPLGDMAAALRRVQAGDLDARVLVGASDELGALEDGVNQMVVALREKERILQTFGRIVEPSIRWRATCVWAESCVKRRSCSAICVASRLWPRETRPRTSSPRSTASSAS